MISIAESKKILNQNGFHYTDEEVEVIRDFLYKLAEIDLTLFKRKQERLLMERKQTKIVSLNNDHHEKESHSLHPRIYRRTG